MVRNDHRCKWFRDVVSEQLLCTNRFWRPSSSLILLLLLHGVLDFFFFFFLRCLILNCNVFSRRLSSSALSNPSWQSSPSSCRPLANITMETLSEQHHMSFFSISFFMYRTHPCHCRQACFAVYAHAGNNLRMEIIISPLGRCKCFELNGFTIEQKVPGWNFLMRAFRYFTACCPSCVTIQAHNPASWELLVLQRIIERFLKYGLKKLYHFILTFPEM